MFIKPVIQPTLRERLRVEASSLRADRELAVANRQSFIDAAEQAAQDALIYAKKAAAVESALAILQAAEVDI